MPWGLSLPCEEQRLPQPAWVGGIWGSFPSMLQLTTVPPKAGEPPGVRAMGSAQTPRLCCQVLLHSGLGPGGGQQEEGERKPRLAGLGSPSPTAITGNEREQEKPTRRLSVSCSSTQVSSPNPFLFSQASPEAWRVCCQRITCSLPRTGTRETRQSPSLADPPPWPGGRACTGVSGGF